MRTGYLIEYGEKKGFFEGIGARQRVIVTDTKLIEMLQSKARYVIWNATWINIDEYIINHPGEDISMLE